MDTKKIVAIVGMTGAGKSMASDYLVEHGYSFLRFGQVTLDIVNERGLSGEDAEKQVREEIRKEHGMAAFAKLIIPKFDALLEQGKKIVADGLYSWSEYKVLKERYGDDGIIVICIYASPETRYKRLVERRPPEGEEDLEKRWRSTPPEDSKKRDIAEIENIEKGGPIAMSDFTIVNEGTLEELYKQLDKIVFSK